jgi:hypothetical protein
VLQQILQLLNDDDGTHTKSTEINYLEDKTTGLIPNLDLELYRSFNIF